MNTTTSPSPPDHNHARLLFIGGGNMANAIIGGLLRQGWPASAITVIEPLEAARIAFEQQGLATHTNADSAQAACSQADLVIWAVKPQSLAEATAPIAPHCPQALHLSIAAGIPTASLSRWLGSEKIVRAMPNTPALIGQGICGLYAGAAVDEAGRNLVTQVLAGTGRSLWVAQEADLDAVTALSGSGPAYVFLLLEAMTDAGAQMGLPPAQAYQLAVATFQGAAALAAQSEEDAATLRQRVTSKGGTTHAAITHMQQMQIPEHFAAALHQARHRAQELAAEFGQ